MKIAITVVVCFLTTAATCGHEVHTDGNAAPDAGSAVSTQTPSLYDRLGGKPTVSNLVDAFISAAASNEATKKRFASIDKLSLTERICMELAGPCEAKETITKKFKALTRADFDATAAAMKASLDSAKVPAADQPAVLEALGLSRFKAPHESIMGQGNPGTNCYYDVLVDGIVCTDDGGGATGGDIDIAQLECMQRCEEKYSKCKKAQLVSLALCLRERRECLNGC